MEVTGKCYCGAVEYKASGDPLFKGQCHCRECQYLAGGSPNVFMAMPADGFSYTKGEPKQFLRPDLDAPVTREFCGNCGTHLLTRTPNMAGAVVLKVGSMDDPSLYEMPQVAIYLSDKQDFHTVPDGVATFDKLPG